MNRTPWPKLDYASWGPTKRSLHAYAQMLGKLRLALAPPQPNFLFTSLQCTARGFTTGAIPYRLRSLQASVDVFSAQMILESSDGGREYIALSAPRTIAGVYADLRTALEALEISVTLSPIPQETPDRTPLDVDDRPAVFEERDARNWLTVITATNAVFDRWRGHFSGRAGIQLWWGAFDFALLLFNGKRVEAPTTRGYLLKYDLDAEMMNVGFYPGDAQTPAYYYGYIYPQPEQCQSRPVEPKDAVWSETLGEWILPYEAVRTSADPEEALRSFLDSIWLVCCNASGWDRAALSYVPPPLRHARLEPRRP
jgi:hypothetical protein